jgi:hypothetical protein
MSPWHARTGTSPLRTYSWGFLRQDIGTVPRALPAAGVDRVALLSRAERLLD